MNRNLGLLACFFAVGIFVTGCEQNKVSKGTAKGESLKGEVKVEGSSTVEPISLVAKAKFNKDFPNVNISVAGNGSGNGFKALSKKECNFSDASRPIKQKEFDSCKETKVEFIEVPVAFDGLTIVVNPKNEFVTQLTVDDLKKIFRKDMAAKTWKEINDAWPDKKIDIFAPGTASGTHDYFMEVVDKGKESGMRSDDQIQMNEDDKILVDGVKNNEFSIGFFGYAYFEANKDDLKAVPIVNGSGTAVTPSIDTIKSGEYSPFSRPLFIYVNKESYDSVEVREFVDFYLENIVDIVKEASYVPLPQAVYVSAREHLDNGWIGTHYLTEDGKKRSGGIEEVYKKENLLK